MLYLNRKTDYMLHRESPASLRNKCLCSSTGEVFSGDPLWRAHRASLGWESPGRRHRDYELRNSTLRAWDNQEGHSTEAFDERDIANLWIIHSSSHTNVEKMLNPDKVLVQSFSFLLVKSIISDHTHTYRRWYKTYTLCYCSQSPRPEYS